ncbi:MAG: hypothetical protein ACM3VS_16195 [Candidatus Dadabacteria bacterium]
MICEDDLLDYHQPNNKRYDKKQQPEYGNSNIHSSIMKCRKPFLFLGTPFPENVLFHIQGKKEYGGKSKERDCHEIVRYVNRIEFPMMWWRFQVLDTGYLIGK